MKLTCLFLLLFAFSSTSWGRIQIPRSLTHKDRIEALSTLGLGAQSSLVSDPYPLGGFSGLEIGFLIDTLNIENLERLGDKNANNPSDFSYSQFVIGKGLFHDVDIFLLFAPFTQSSGLSNYGALLRWTFYQGQFVPTLFSIVVQGQNTNIQNQVMTSSYSVDLVSGVHVNNFSLYIGVGQTLIDGTFIGGGVGVGLNAETNGSVIETAYENLFANHSFVGASLNFVPLFVSFQLDRYTNTQPSYSVKLGFRL